MWLPIDVLINDSYKITICELTAWKTGRQMNGSFAEVLCFVGFLLEMD